MSDMLSTYGNWTVLAPAEPSGYSRRWKCKCSCGAENVVLEKSLVTGQSKSCGCRRAEVTRLVRLTHGMSGEKIYWIWAAMVDRCRNENNPGFKNYGGRGINVSDRWMTFSNFYADMGDRPEGMSLDRINNSLGYSKDNCKWSTRKEQAINKRNCIAVNIDGSTMNLKEACALIGRSYRMVTKRIRKGMNVMLALTKESCRA